MTAQTTDWWQEAVFYEIFVRSFYDTNGDGKGDFQGLIEKLDYLNDGDPTTDTDLGITGIWLMPINESPSYHGYDVVDYRDVDQEYGTMNEFQAFLAAAHQRGIKVIIDYVINHTSTQHPWFSSSASNPNSPFRDWYTWESSNPGYNGPWGQNVWHFNNGAYYLGIFWGGMPDLNFHTPEVQAEIFDITTYWLQDIGVDGFRLDAIKHLFEDGPNMEHVAENFPFLEDFNQHYKSINPQAYTVGEVWSNTSSIVPYVTNNRLDMCFDFDLADRIISGLNSNNAQGVRNQIQVLIDTYPNDNWASFLANHDQNRLFFQLGGIIQNVGVAAATYLTLPGVPYLYYGEEIAMSGNGPDENKRRPMQWDSSPNAGFSSTTPWHPINTNYEFYNVADMQADPNSLWNWYRQLIHARNASPALQTGATALLEPEQSSTLAYTRYNEEEQLIILHNYGTISQTIENLEDPEQVLNSGNYTLRNMLTNEAIGTIEVSENNEISLPTSIPLAGKSSLLLSLDQLDAVSTLDSDIDIHLYPNPSKGLVVLDLPESIFPATISICDINGKVVWEKILQFSDQNELDLNGLPANIYALSVKSASIHFRQLLVID